MNLRICGGELLRYLADFSNQLTLTFFVLLFPEPNKLWKRAESKYTDTQATTPIKQIESSIKYWNQ